MIATVFSLNTAWAGDAEKKSYKMIERDVAAKVPVPDIIKHAVDSGMDIGSVVDALIKSGTDASSVVYTSITEGYPAGDVVRSAVEADAPLNTVVNSAINGGADTEMVAKGALKAGESPSAVATEISAATAPQSPVFSSSPFSGRKHSAKQKKGDDDSNSISGSNSLDTAISMD